MFRRIPGDPHPVAYIRVLLGAQMCIRFYFAGPWDDMARAGSPVNAKLRVLRRERLASDSVSSTAA